MREDLAALTPDALASLSSRGLLKRAQRMVETGLGPAEIQEYPDGVVFGRFGDDTTIHLPPKATLAQARCSCGAVFACRHGLALVLAYQAREGTADAELERWSPAEFSDQEVRTLIGKLGRARAGRMLRGGLVVKTGYEPHPTARLPTCTVQFLVPHDLTHARCDCELGTACEHLWIAVQAFRQVGERDHATVELAATGELDLEATKAARELAHEVLWTGVTGAPEALEGRFERARQALDADGQVWPMSLLDELERTLKWYRGRSARYRPGVAADAACELEARYRAAVSAAGGHEEALPVGVVLGTAESSVTRLAELRLVSLGARVRSEGKTTIAQVYLVDLDTGNVLVLAKEATGPEDASAPTSAELANRETAPGVRLVDVAYGQLLTQAARRKANRELMLGGGAAARTQVSRQAGDWSGIGAPVNIRDFESFEAQLAQRAPTMLRPRILAENVHVLAVDEVLGLFWSPGEQALVAQVKLPSGDEVRVERRHRSVAPHAIAALAHALADQPTFISGEIRHTEAGILLAPIAVVCGEEGRLVVPDLETQAEEVQLMVGDTGVGLSPLAAAVDLAVEVVDEGAHRGLLASPKGWGDRLEEAADRLFGLGMSGVAAAVRAAGAEAMKARAGGRSAAPEAAARWMDARLSLALARELVRA